MSLAHKNAHNFAKKHSTKKILPVLSESGSRTEDPRTLSRRLARKRPQTCCYPTTGIWRWSILIFSASFLTSGYFADESIGATVPYLQQNYNYTSQQIGALYSSGFIPNTVTSLLGGVLIDKFGTNKMSIIYNTFLLFGSVIFAFSPVYWGKILGRFVFGLGLEPLEVCQDTMLNRWFYEDEDTPENKRESPSMAFAFGFSFAMAQLGQLLGTNILPILGGIQLEYAYFAASGMIAIGCIFNIFVVIMDRKAQPILGLSNGEDEEPFSLKHLKKFPAQFWLLGGVTFCVFSATLTFTAYATDLVNTKYGYSVPDSGHIASSVFAISILSSPLIGFLIDKYGVFTYVMGIGCCLFTAGQLVLSFTNVHPLVPYALIGLSYSMVPNSIWPAISMVCGDENAGTAFGTITAINSLELLVVPYVCGFLLDRFGSYVYVTYLLAASGGLGLVLSIILHIVDSRRDRFLFFDKKKEEEKNEKSPLLVNGSTSSISETGSK